MERDNELLSSSRKLLKNLEIWPESSPDWRLIEETKSGRPTTDYLLRLSGWLAEQVVHANGFVLKENTSELSRAFANVAGLVEPIATFQKRAASDDTYNQYYDAVRRRTDRLLQGLGIWAVSHAAQRVDRTPHTLIEQRRVSESLLKEIEENAVASRNAVDMARNDAVTYSMEAFGRMFKDDAASYRARARGWLAAGTVTLLLAAGTAVWIICAAADRPAADWSWVQTLTGKAFILSLLTYATTWCGRMALACDHNASVNRHRENSIGTVRAFRESGTDDATKDAIVMEAARAVFENVQTGYLGKSADSPALVSRTVEIAKTARS